jgi:AcrR family transcriptional regulator
MAYRKTEKVLAQLAAQKDRFVNAAIEVITAGGMGALTVDNVLLAAEAPTGLFYRYFPDKAELLAEVVHVLAERDIAAIMAAAEAEDHPLDALAAAVEAYYLRRRDCRIVGLDEAPFYSAKLRDVLAPIVREAGAGLSAQSARLIAGAALGAVSGMLSTYGGRQQDALAAVLFVLRGLGVSHAHATKAYMRDRERT